MSKNICLVGEIVIDVTKRTVHSDIKMRLGGIVHAARGLWALNIPFDVAYFAPSYLDDQIYNYLASLGCQKIEKLGNVTGAPGVFLIEEAKEVGDQGYEYLLRDEIKVNTDLDVLNRISQQQYKDVLMISGNYNLNQVATNIGECIHLDIANNITDLSSLSCLGRKVETLFLSTSSQLFLKHYSGQFEEFTKLFKSYCQRLILKENRGGSRAIDFLTNAKAEIPAQPRKIAHSVGVGDVYDATFIGCNFNQSNFHSSLVLASWVAAEYASTTYPDDLKTNVQRILRSPLSDLMNMPGVFLPWEQRKNIHVYLAAPDFSFVDTSYVDDIEKALAYHNFTPRRPVKENGEMEKDASKERRQELFHNDMKMLSQCKVLIAILLYNDPGTLIEIGLAAANGLPTLVYDPYGIASNCMLTELPTLVTSDPDELITEVFYQVSKQILNE